jgi:hypothetical protein
MTAAKGKTEEARLLRPDIRAITVTVEGLSPPPSCPGGKISFSSERSRHEFRPPLVLHLRRVRYGPFPHGPARPNRPSDRLRPCPGSGPGARLGIRPWCSLTGPAHRMGGFAA